MLSSPSQHGLTEPCTIHGLFEAQVASTPDSTAVQFQDQWLTYHELNLQANRVAHSLRAVGVRPEVRVGLALSRSLDLIVGLLGILKAGGACVPLDPAYPHKRLEFMLADAALPVLLTHTRLVQHLPIHNACVLCLDSDDIPLSDSCVENPTVSVTEDALAYVLYTSGSTGQPKGTMLEHRAIVNFIRAACRAYELSPDDRILQFASYNFDSSIEEIYPALTAGATLVLRTDAMLDSMSTFLRGRRAMSLR